MGILKDKFKEVIVSIMPVVAVLVILAIWLLKLDWEQIMLFIICVVMVVAGFTIFLAGVDVGIDPMGSAIGKEIPKRRSKLFMVLIIFVISFLVTVAEPDVSVFASQVVGMQADQRITGDILVISIALGVAIFLIVSAFKIVYNLSLKMILTISYLVVIGISIYLYIQSQYDFIGVAMDSGGVTTGPVTVPVLLALGIGICSIGKHRSKMDGFGMIGMASVGPIIAVLIVGAIFITNDVPKTVLAIDGEPAAETMVISVNLMMEEMISSLSSVIVALVPLSLFFIFFQKIFLRYSWAAVGDTLKGVAFAGLGVVIFLTGVYSGFMPLATEIGVKIISDETINSMLIVGVGFVLGFLVAFAEPAVGILGGQVESASKGAITKKSIILMISVGVASFVAIGMIRILLDFNIIFIVVPGFVITLILMWFTDKNMVGIAFDAGGVSTGPMSVAVLSAMYVGISSELYSSSRVEALSNGFGLICLIALAPCFSICLLNVVTKIRNRLSEGLYES